MGPLYSYQGLAFSFWHMATKKGGAVGLRAKFGARKGLRRGWVGVVYDEAKEICNPFLFFVSFLLINRVLRSALNALPRQLRRVKCFGDAQNIFLSPLPSLFSSPSLCRR
eukprot:Phypoly_transcript_12911.p1 GENE.Phypoly_transcript_12911~~Phypoly_transcript_12911.p1  ORF type:complete len:110 (-),score=8.64 Phypoly_transcript_12911:350-679(-)